MLPSQYLEVQGYPSLQRLLQAQVDMQFADLRTLLCLPIPQAGLEAGCNFACAAVLFNMIAGASVCFYETSENAVVDRSSRGMRFKRVLEKFYPWHKEPFGKDQCVLTLYDLARNPLTHSLGLGAVSESATGKQVALRKWPINPSQIDELEGAIARPGWLPPTVDHPTSDYGAIDLVLSVPTLYWGVHRMLHALFTDSDQASKADALAKSIGHQWDRYAPGESV